MPRTKAAVNQQKVVGNRKAGNQQQKKQTQQVARMPRGIRPTQPLGANSTSVAAAYSAPVKNNRPSIVYGPQGRSCRVMHKEFIQNVVGTTLYQVVQFLALNPGLAGTFPWLSNIANNFEQYRCHKMRFCYLTRTGTNIPGSVLMAPDYDASDTAPVSEQIMSNYAEIVEDAPWKDICCILRPAGMHALGPRKFVRNGLVPGQDLKTTDVGTFILATVDGTAVNWGKLWVEYDFEFFEPQLNPSGSFQASSGQGATGTTLSIFATVPVIAGPLIAAVVNNTFFLQNLIPGGTYAIFYGQDSSATTPTFAFISGITSVGDKFSGANHDGEIFTVNQGVTTAVLTITLSGLAAHTTVVIAPVVPGLV